MHKLKKIINITFLFIVIPILAFSQPADTVLASQYFQKALTLQRTARYDSSIYYFQKASELYLHCTTVGVDSLFPTEYPEAQADGKENLATNEAIWAKYVICCWRMGWNYMLKAQYTKAFKHVAKGLESGLEILGNEHRVVGECYHAFGTLYYFKGQYDEALECHQKALNIKLKTFGRTHNSVATSYNNIAIVYRVKGDYGTAIEYYQQSLRIFVNTFGRNHISTAKIYNNIGNVYFMMLDNDKAMEYYQQSLDIKLKILDKDHPSLATSYNNLGAVYTLKGDYERAMKYHKQALNIRLNKFGMDHPVMAQSYINIGGIYAEKGDKEKTLEYFNISLKIRLNTLGSYHPRVGQCFNVFGDLYRKTAAESLSADSAVVEYKKAIQYYQKAIGALVAPSPKLKKQGTGTHYKTIYENPVIPTIYDVKEGRNTINSNVVLKDALMWKAEVFYKIWLIKSRN
ncbi:MAG: tetratricopeptide repeat protein [Cytophagales bacterium]|nr:tetratricopeptide repeat protein [Cytophagales bacterium]